MCLPVCLLRHSRRPAAGPGFCSFAILYCAGSFAPVVGWEGAETAIERTGSYVLGVRPDRGSDPDPEGALGVQDIEAASWEPCSVKTSLKSAAAWEPSGEAVFAACSEQIEGACRVLLMDREAKARLSVHTQRCQLCQH